MRVILVSMGTCGDVYPFVGLGTRLRERGHHVTLAANEGFQKLATIQKLDFCSLVSEEESSALLANPDLWRPLKSAWVGAHWAGPLIERQYRVLTKLARAADTVLVAYPPVFAARLVQETLSCPLVSLVAMPWMIPSVADPPLLAGRLNLPRRTPRAIVRPWWRLLELIADLLIGRYVNRVRKGIGMPSVTRVARWAFSPRLVIGLFPEWYAAPQPDWPYPTRLAGFGLFDGMSNRSVPNEILDLCRTGSPTIAFTFGTGMKHGAALFRAAKCACEILGAQGIFLTRFEAQLPSPLPSFLLHCREASFRELFAQCDAVVHHGGLGTTAQALASATPQLVLPMAWDQVDNATRVKRLGAGDWIPPGSNGKRIASTLKRLMSDPQRAQCRKLATRFGTHDPYETAAIWIEEAMVSNPNSPPR